MTSLVKTIEFTELALKDNTIYETVLQRIELPWYCGLEVSRTPGTMGSRMSDDEYARYEWKDDSEGFEAFFSEEVNVQRLLYCPQINIDMTDDWGMFGYEQGFIFIKETQNTGLQCFNDQTFLTGKSLKQQGEIYLLPHFDYFPRNKYDYSVITKTRQPYLYDWLVQKFL